MTIEQEKLYGLLDDIASACAKHKVNYYLIGDELLWNVRKKNHMRCRADVCMTFETYKTIASDLEGMPDRITENIHTNRDLPGVYFRFADTTSFMLEPEYHKVVRECGIAVNIHILRKVCPEADALERFETVMGNEIEGVGRNVSDEAVSEFCALKKTDDFSNRMEKMLIECSLKKNGLSGNSSLNLPGRDSLVFPDVFWEKPGFITVAGKKYMTVREKNEYLNIHYGDPGNVIPHADTFMNRVIVNAEIPYSKVRDDILAELDDREFWDKRKILFDGYFGKYDKLIMERRRLDGYMRAAAERIYLWKKYYPQKEKIKRLLRDRRIDELHLVFEEMESSIRRFEVYGFLCVFDKDILEIYLDMLKTEGYRDRVAELERLYEDGVFEELDEERMKGFY